MHSWSFLMGMITDARTSSDTVLPLPFITHSLIQFFPFIRETVNGCAAIARCLVRLSHNTQLYNDKDLLTAGKVPWHPPFPRCHSDRNSIYFRLTLSLIFPLLFNKRPMIILSSLSSLHSNNNFPRKIQRNFLLRITQHLQVRPHLYVILWP